MIQKKYKFELSENDILSAIRDSCKYALDRHEIREALVKAIGLELKEVDLERYITKASEKAIKDIARWKLLQDYISIRKDNDDMIRQFTNMKDSYDKVMDEIHEFKDILKHLREQYELLKA